MSTEQMKQLIIELRSAATTLRAFADERDKLADGYQAEVDAKGLAAYWETHPELEKINVGDKLLVTEEAFKSKKIFTFPVGSIISFDQIDIFDTQLTYNLHTNRGVWLFDSGEIVSNMRRAYLSQRQETE